MKQSNTYRRKNIPPVAHSRFELIYGKIAIKLIRGQRINPGNIIPLSKLLAVFVWLFSWPYELYKRVIVVAKIRKARSEH